MGQKLLTYIAKDLKDLDQIAKKIIANLTFSKLIILEGDLGAGKTTLSKYIAKNWGIKDEIVSPTYNICLTYNSGDKTLKHYDLYRIETINEISQSIDFFEELDDLNTLIIVEWFKFFQIDDHVLVKINLLSNGQREFIIEIKN